MSSVQRTKEGTPIWDGEPATFQEFEELALLWEAGTPYHKRYTCAPKLIAELGGSAKRLTLGKTADWLPAAALNPLLGPRTHRTAVQVLSQQPTKGPGQEVV